MGMVRPSMPGARVGQVPSLGHRRDQPVDGEGHQLGMGAPGRPSTNPNTWSPTRVRRDVLPDADHGPAVLRPSTWTRGRGHPQKARLIQGCPDR